VIYFPIAIFKAEWGILISFITGVTETDWDSVTPLLPFGDIHDLWQAILPYCTGTLDMWRITVIVFIFWPILIQFLWHRCSFYSGVLENGPTFPSSQVLGSMKQKNFSQTTISLMSFGSLTTAFPKGYFWDASLTPHVGWIGLGLKGLSICSLYLGGDTGTRHVIDWVTGQPSWYCSE
jgi:hypothetical protein